MNYSKPAVPDNQDESPKMEPVSARPTPAEHDRGGVSPAIMAVYSAIVGKIPEIDPTVVNEDIMTLMGESTPQRHWSPTTLSLYLKDIYRHGQIALQVHKPDVTAWLRRQTVIARKRLIETQTRLVSAHRDRAA